LSTGLQGQTLEKFIVANGSGGNGKGVINELALSTFGNYGYVLPSNVLLNPLKTGSNPEVANLKYKRLVIAREPDSQFKINCSTIKELTGGNALNARQNYSNDTETILQLTLILECNEKPKLNEVNDAIFRRIIDIPFVSSFVDKQTYDKLDNKTNVYVKNDYYKTNEFKNKYKQALFRLIAKHKFENILPQQIIKRNLEYMQNSDIIFEFIDELAVKTDNKKDSIKMCLLYDAFKESQFYENLTKIEKKNYTYKQFNLQISSNLFFKKYVNTDKSNVMILSYHQLKNNENIII
jgi:phage/plasmid-associated DNA primase